MQTHRTPTYRPRRASIAATGLLGCLVALAGASTPLATTAHASAAVDAQSDTSGTLRYHLGYSIQHGWLCYGWRSGAFHCTRWWTRHNGLLISEDRAWTPSQAAKVSMISVKRVVTTAVKKVGSVASSRVSVRNTYPYGVCTWGAQALKPTENLSGLGNARDWLWRARARGLPTGSQPRVGATVVFAPGVQGASWLGHVGHVVQVGSGGSFLMEAMNDSAGWGRYAFRWVHAGYGVGFIY